MIFLVGCGDGLFTRSVSPPGGDAAVLDGGGDDLPDAAPTVNAINIVAGGFGELYLGPAKVTVRSMSFDQDVTLTIEAMDPLPIGPTGKWYRVSEKPAGAHSGNLMEFELTLDASTDAIHDQFSLGTRKAVAPPPKWTIPASEKYIAAMRILAADFILDSGPVDFGLMRICTLKADCRAIETCSAGLCQ